MRKTIITFAFVFFAFIAQAQENKFAANRAENAVALIASSMDISEEDAEFLQQTLYNKYASNARKIRGNNLSAEEKKEVYRSAAKENRKILMSKFSKEKVQKIIELERKSFKK